MKPDNDFHDSARESSQGAGAVWRPEDAAAFGDALADAFDEGREDRGGDRGLQASDPRSDADALARALDCIASRVRAGELVAPGYEAGMGDAAALTAALAAVLGVGV